MARNGPEFESRIRQNELNNPKFNFLNGGDPYHAYYQHRVEEIREGKAGQSGDSGGALQDASSLCSFEMMFGVGNVLKGVSRDQTVFS